MKKFFFVKFFNLFKFTKKFSSSEMKLKNFDIERIQFNTINSTQIYARENYEILLENNHKWYSIIADSQTAGIGQYNRKWYSDNSNLSFTLIIPHKIKNTSENLNLLSIYTSYLVCESLRKFDSKLNPKIKWVNDILLDNKKLCGILVESIIKNQNEFIFLIGIGINVNLNIDNVEIYSKINQPIISIKNYLKLKQDINKIQLYEIIEQTIYTNLKLFLNNENLNPSEIFEKINNNLAFKNQKVKIIDKYDEQKITIGIFEGLDQQTGHIILKISDNEKIKLSDGRMFLQ